MISPRLPRRIAGIFLVLLSAAPIAPALTATGVSGSGTAFLPTARLARERYGNDAPWYEANVPLFECSDARIEEIYAYRWALYKAHIRDLGAKGTIVTEFLDDVGWQRWPWASLNDATPFHIREGRWLRDRSVVDGYIDFLYDGGGNDRHFSEGIAAATFDAFLANGDAKFATKHLGSMRHVFNLWDDHFDFAKGLYFIEPLLDATEYTISSIDASGGKDGFRGGDAFRPTINAYQYGNARAISRLSALAGDGAGAKAYAARAETLKATVQRSLWNEKLAHFTDRYQVNNANVRYWDFIRGRELAGYVPWTYGLPDDEPKYAAAWRHLLDPGEFAGPHGLRTVGPSYEHFMRQYRYEGKNPECQWNGPSWPFQTTQVLTGMANVLNDYRHREIGPNDYVAILRQYAEQHLLDGKPNLQEDYDPETGRPIVGLARSHHYNHSGFTDLVISGLCGLRAREDDVLEVNPIVGKGENAIRSFLLENVPYHGHAVTIQWDVDGTRYGRGIGLSVYVDGARKIGPRPLGRATCAMGRPRIVTTQKRVNLAANAARQGFPAPSASGGDDVGRWQAIDGRTWFFPEMVRGWTPGTGSGSDWYAIDFGRETMLDEVRLAFLENAGEYAPEAYRVEAWTEGEWRPVERVHRTPDRPIANGANIATFAPFKTERLRIVFDHARPMRLVELSVFGGPSA